MSCYCCYLSLPAYGYLPTYLPMTTYVPISPTYLSTDLPTTTYQHVPTYVNLPSSIYLSLLIPKYQYIIAADPEASIGLVILYFFI